MGVGDEGFQPSLGNFFAFEKVTKKKTTNYVFCIFLRSASAMTLLLKDFAHRPIRTVVASFSRSALMR
jgi:hypothetical protein